MLTIFRTENFEMSPIIQHLLLNKQYLRSPTFCATIKNMNKFEAYSNKPNISLLHDEPADSIAMFFYFKDMCQTASFIRMIENNLFHKKQNFPCFEIVWNCTNSNPILLQFVHTFKNLSVFWKIFLARLHYVHTYVKNNMNVFSH